MQEDTIVGIASGMGGGIGIIRVSGSNALELVGKIFRTKKYLHDDLEWDNHYFLKKDSHTIHYGFIINDDHFVMDEVMVLLMKAPRSYTTEDVIEIDSHGGPFLVQKILELLIQHGARLAEPGEFTKRAFLNGRIDLSQAEAIMKMISSKSDFALNNAMEQLQGRVSEYIEETRQKILYEMGFIESALDDPEHYSLDGYSEQLYEIIKQEKDKLEKLLTNFEHGRIKSEGINTVIVGKPNAGKSSLMNLLLNEERAIVTNIAGTTRDILEETVHLGSLILNLVDTAGIHNTEDIVEALGVEKAMKYLERADFIIYVVDSTDDFDEADENIIQLCQGKTGVILFNKSDIAEKNRKIEKYSTHVEKLNWKFIPFSAKTADGLKELENYITELFLKGDIIYNDQIYLSHVRHKEAVENACNSLKNVLDTIDDGMPEDLLMVDMMDAYQSLGLINGETASEDLVNKIFREFCMGK